MGGRARGGFGRTWKAEHSVSRETTIDEFVSALASSAPTPGGGAASALAGALAGALAEMVGRLTTGRAKYRDVEPVVQRLLALLAERREELVGLIDEDAAAYQQVAAAYGMPRAADEERAAREAAIQGALGAAMDPPRRIALAAAEVLRAAGEIAEIGNPGVASDAGCAAILAEAAVRCAGLNVLANVVLLRDGQAGAAAREEMALLEADARPLLDRTLAVVRARMGA